ncbi:lysine-rich nucleolar protein 1 [Candoia aspera]|uniref:lysine-rich nucleolar protein 1 n=1 Tax=Candoia aspera TaxID=51853 RepID=UPI002FD7C232
MYVEPLSLVDFLPPRKVLENMKNPEQTTRKKNKATDLNCGQVVIIESTKERCYSDLARKVKPNKKKRLLKEMGSERLDPKKKNKQSNSELKKKARTSSPVILESNSDSELLRGTRKRLKMFKKKEERKLSCKRVQDCEALGEREPDTEFHVSKKRKRNILEGQDEELMMKSKKKKKEKRKHNPTCSLVLHSVVREESVKQISGKISDLGCQAVSFSSQKKRRTLGRKVVRDSVLVKKKQLGYYMGYQENSSGIASCVCKLQDAQSWDGHLQWQEVLACRSETGSEATKKKKKKLKKGNTASLSSLAKNQENHGSIRSECCLKFPSQKGLGVGRVPKEVNKLAKKKKREAGDVGHLSEDGQDVLSKVRAPGGKEKRKKAKKADVEPDCVVRNGRDRSEDSQEWQIKKKTKNPETGSSQDSDREASWKKAKTKKAPKETEDEVKLVAFKKGNCDEVNIDKVRRQALQEEIDRESGKTKTVKEELMSVHLLGLDNHFGQWSTATFGTSEQKATFLRLLGGFKKGLASAQSSPANATKSNMALERSREQKLQHNL